MLAKQSILQPTGDSPLQTVIKLTLVASFGFIRYIAGGLDGFLSCFNGFFVFSGRFGPGGREKQNKQQLYIWLRHTDAFRSRMKAERDKSFSTAALSRQKRNGPIAILYSALILWDLSI